ncbi:MAG: hypothetical protein A3E01_17075 [Gammaproteobacteria bacterium RIFCSPHIGHO2_12_FULL_63_22]|nr:MAG: hypothetical protein A3E01_17075 [Gammaproteobacteria bacterium RIFCSPHIGHO2_12_FULL_63_22]
MSEHNPYDAPNATVADIDDQQVQLAGRGMRLVGSLIDTVLMLVILVPAMFAGGYISSIMSGVEPSFVNQMQWGLIGFIIFLVVQGFPLYSSGQTWGKKALGIKIVDMQGNKPEFGKLIGLRYLTTWVIGLVPVLGTIYQFVNVLFIFGNDRRCIHDKIAGTRVVMAN